VIGRTVQCIPASASHPQPMQGTHYTSGLGLTEQCNSYGGVVIGRMPRYICLWRGGDRSDAAVYTYAGAVIGRTTRYILMEGL
jgi:hypothetical protein